MIFLVANRHAHKLGQVELNFIRTVRGMLSVVTGGDDYSVLIGRSSIMLAIAELVTVVAYSKNLGPMYVLVLLDYH